MKFKAAAGPWLSGRRRWSLRCLCFSVSSLLALFSLFVVSTSCQSVPDESPSIATPSNPTAVETTSLDPNAADHRPHGAHRQRRNQRFMLTAAAVAAFAVLAKLFSNVINRRTVRTTNTKNLQRINSLRQPFKTLKITLQTINNPRCCLESP